MGKLERSAAIKMPFSILVKTALFSVIGHGALSAETTNSKMILGVLFVFAVMCLFELSVFLPNYEKHKKLKKVLGVSYDREVGNKIDEDGLLKLFYSFWFVRRWKVHQEKLKYLKTMGSNN